jgi:hypothetical protein
METGLIGVFAILEMALAARLLALILVPFFIVHFGGFMLAHIFYLTLMFGGGVPASLSAMPEPVWQLLVQRGLWIAFGALFVSHSVSFALNVVRPAWRQWRQQAGDALWQATLIPSGNPQTVMFAPYRRIVVMHVTIIIVAFLVEIFKIRAAAFVLLVVLKIVVDIAAHVRKNLRPGLRPE